MAFDIRLEDERGNTIDSASDTGVLGRILPELYDTRFILLRFIDPYGDTVFNRMQIETFIEEWKRIYPSEAPPEERTFMCKVEELAERCRSEPHLYLKFYGD